jgi:restriction system protein
MAAKITRERVGEFMKVVLSELKSLGGEARLKDLLDRVEPKLNLSEYEKGTYEKSGYVRWRSIVHFYSIDLVKAGYIQKQNGKWFLTPEGEKAMQKPAGEFIKSAMDQYRVVMREAQKLSQPEIGEQGIDTEQVEEKLVRQTAYEQAVAQARAEIEDQINNLGWYDFQKLVAELLKAMGYHVPFVAPPGKDGGIDVIAYRDPLGTSTPRIKAQIKHRNQKVSVGEVRELEGLLRKEGDIGLIVSSGGFTADVEREIRASSKHIETMDLDRLISLWQQHYDQISEPGKALLPLAKLYFLAPPEE